MKKETEGVNVEIDDSKGSGCFWIIILIIIAIATYRIVEMVLIHQENQSEQLDLTN